LLPNYKQLKTATTLVRLQTLHQSGKSDPAGNMSSCQHSSKDHRGMQAPPL